MALSFELARAFVTLQAQGGEGLRNSLGEIGARVEAMRSKANALAPLVEYARASGLQLKGTAQETQRLVEALARVKTPAGFDAWLKTQKDLQTVTEGVVKFTAAAGRAFSQGKSLLEGFVAAASPAHWETLQGSIGLVSTAIGQAFLPYVEMAVDWLQDLAEWIHNLDPETKASIASWVMWGGAVLGAAVVIPKIIGLVQGVISVLGVLASGVKLAAAGFMTLVPALRAAGAAMLSFAASNPVTTILAIAGALAALVAGFSAASQGVEDMTGRFERLEGVLERLRSGEQLTGRELQEVFSAQQVQRLQGARPEQRREVARQIIAEERATSAGRQTASGIQRQGNTAARLAEEAQRSGTAGDLRGDFAHVIAARNRLAEQGRESGLSRGAISRLIRGLEQGRTPAQIRDSIQEPVTRALARIEAARQIERTGQVPGAAQGRQRLTNVSFRSELGDIGSAWRRLQVAANSMTPLQRETQRWQLEVQTRLTEIRDRMPDRPGGPEAPPIGPAPGAAGARGW